MSLRDGVERLYLVMVERVLSRVFVSGQMKAFGSLVNRVTCMIVRLSQRSKIHRAVATGLEFSLLVMSCIHGLTQNKRNKKPKI